MTDKKTGWSDWWKYFRQSALWLVPATVVSLAGEPLARLLHVPAPHLALAMLGFMAGGTLVWCVVTWRAAEEKTKALEERFKAEDALLLSAASQRPEQTK